jgi:predicted NUDIX family NTP pyrophosphohydrolase
MPSMRKVLVAVVLLMLAGGGFWGLGQSGAQKAPLGLLLSGADTQKVAKLSQSFLEDVQFKDFKAAAQYSSPEDRDKADIPKLIERLFQVKPELLDITNVQLLSSELDSSKRRAKVKLGTDVKLLNSEELRHPEVILYWKKQASGQWYMDLSSSLQ